MKEQLMMQKIREYKIRQDGVRGAVISIPKVFMTDNNIISGDSIEIHRATIGDIDALVVIKKQNKEQIN